MAAALVCPALSDDEDTDIEFDRIDRLVTKEDFFFQAWMSIHNKASLFMRKIKPGARRRGNELLCSSVDKKSFSCPHGLPAGKDAQRRGDHQ